MLLNSELGKDTCGQPSLEPVQAVQAIGARCRAVGLGFEDTQIWYSF